MTEAITSVTEIKKRIIEEFSNANKSIRIAMAYFTDREIAMSLVEANKRGVEIEVVISTSSQNEIVSLILKGSDIPIQVYNTDDKRGSMHHKFCLVDKNISISGSFNFTYNASNRNTENVIITDEINVYKKFNEEFESLINAIENNMEFENEPATVNSPDSSINNIDAFVQQLQDLVFSSTKISADDYKLEGHEKSKECFGNVDIYRIEYGNIKERIKVFATNDSLSSTKNLLLSNISNAIEGKKSIIEIEKVKELEAATSYNELLVDQISQSNEDLIKSKSLLELGNTITNDRGAIQINLEIEKNKSEKKSLEGSFLIRKFWNWGTSIKGLLLIILFYYLSVFFSSAMFKLFFEGDELKQILKLGVDPPSPKIIDANSILKIFENEGTLFGIIAMLFFLIPVLFSNLELIGSKNKWMNLLSFWVGIVVFDILVSSMVTINTIKMNAMLIGELNPYIGLFDVIFKSEFWLIFVFGMIPLIITHFLIAGIVDIYNNSQRELVDAEKNKKIKTLDLEMLCLLAEKETLVGLIDIKELSINENKAKISGLKSEIKLKNEKIESRYDILLGQYNTIYEDFRSKIISGKIFTEVIFDSAISAYRSGFIEFLQERYSDVEIKSRVNLIEQIK